MRELDELRKQYIEIGERIFELEEGSCVLLRVRGKDVKVAYRKALDKGRAEWQPKSRRSCWISAIPLIVYREAE